MRTAITVHKVAGKWKVFSLPEVSIDDQKQAFKDLVIAEDKKGIEEVQVWESGRGMTKHKKFALPKDEPKPAPAKPHKKV